jgi:hypothetical protein
VLALLLLWLVLYFGIRLFLAARTDLGSGVRLSLAFIPTPVFALFLWNFVRAIRGADELERRIQLEALAVAFPLACCCSRRSASCSARSRSTSRTGATIT